RSGGVQVTITLTSELRGPDKVIVPKGSTAASYTITVPESVAEAVRLYPDGHTIWSRGFPRTTQHRVEFWYAGMF
ncbi:MAG: hypothetical protein PHQ12_14670, partial [Chthoniobacteraceae bacterium]|nr:hypothetical protein [Chthoniobacteraceae bacterium]